METFVKDLKQACRMLRQSPGFSATAIAVLALGIGANTAIFSVVDAVLLKPLPYPKPDRIVRLMNSGPQGDFAAASVPKFNIWRAQTQVLEDVAAADSGGPGINFSGGDRPEQLKGIHVSFEFFDLYGAKAAVGRTFTPEEDRPGGGNVVVLSSGFWQRRFGSDPRIAGRGIRLGGEPYTIIGVLAPGFSFEPAADVYLPFQADPNSVQQAHYFGVAARLKPGVSLGAAQAALKMAAEEFRRKFPNAIGPRNSFTVQPLQQTMVRNVRTALFVLLGAVGCVLLIACANIASLLLVRATGRAREIAIRAAIGAGRWRIIRQLLTESVLLAAIGGAAGLALGAIGVRALLALNPGNIPRIGKDGAGVTLDWRVLAFTVGLALLTGVIFGLFPALQTSRADLNAILKESGARSGAGLRQSKARSLMVITEMALAIVLLIGAGLLIRTFAALGSVDPGFDPHNVLTMNTSLTGARFDQTAAISDMARQTIDRIQALPGVEAVAASCYLPLEGGLGLGFQIEGRPADDRQSQGGAGWAYVTPRFFDVFKVRVVRGRGFTERDNAGAPGVVLINEAMARRYWPHENPIGQRITIGRGMGPNFAEPPREIIGVVGDARDAGLNQDPVNEMFVPLPQVRDGVMALNNRFLPLTWVVRTKVPPFSLAQPVQQVFQDVADLAPGDLRTMDQVVVQSTARDRFNTLLLGVFAFLAIVLASIGLYGLIAYSVEHRTLEFGIRLALGADSPGLRKMIVGQALKLALAGIVIGLAAAFGLTRLMATMLYGVKPTDPLVFASVAVLFGVVAFLASYLPARRAVRIDPVIALRYQ
jgi:putative ABC transport system permease protein